MFRCEDHLGGNGIIAVFNIHFNNLIKSNGSFSCPRNSQVYWELFLAESFGYRKLSNFLEDLSIINSE